MVYLSLLRNIFPVKPFACILGLLTLARSLPLLDPREEPSFDFVDLFEEGDTTEPVEKLCFLLLIGDKVWSLLLLGELSFPF